MQTIGPPPPPSERIATITSGLTSDPGRILDLMKGGAELRRIDRFPLPPAFEICYTSSAVLIEYVTGDAIAALVEAHKLIANGPLPRNCVTYKLAPGAASRPAEPR